MVQVLALYNASHVLDIWKIPNSTKIFNSDSLAISKGCCHEGRKQKLLLVFLCQLRNFIPLRVTETYNLALSLVKVFNDSLEICKGLPFIRKIDLGLWRSAKSGLWFLWILHSQLHRRYLLCELTPSLFASMAFGRMHTQSAQHLPSTV